MHLKVAHSSRTDRERAHTNCNKRESCMIMIHMSLNLAGESVILSASMYLGNIAVIGPHCCS